ncbi:bifunctional tetrahydrofolate synthase/dihydrofolate synthase [Ferrimonas marina]|uniref:Dihydrofolate synthase/folylpolyglutamate synthase n=1 Tax=Ferrimonas marina TaxID=299255 RepID=A0A1M5Y966_9GAMM|nr:bifunctional tetrahydrofolate synthase/dihydrofolate synthase [Ferrimonas marina]SHI08611.1 dihydrofolate synthase / folylpolyglutamate synthase [Ferrimonas marina]
MKPALTASHSLQEWLDCILALHPSEIDLGLDRLRQVAARMGLTALPHSHVITVAGTNGKGTTCALMEQALLNAGYRVGVFSSPHLERYNERVRIDGVELADQHHVDAFAAIAAAQDKVSLTFFEYSALAALWCFAQARPDVVLLEVGLGGRLDATNLIDADQAVITTIDLDHIEYLGNTREAVAREKVGVLRPGRPAVCGDPNPPVTIGVTAELLGVALSQRGRDFILQRHPAHWDYQADGMTLQRLPLPAIPLDNAATALTALGQIPLQVPEAAIRQALAQLVVPGRLEPLGDAPKLVVDVAHNPQAAAYLAQWLAARPEPRLHAVCAMLKDKDIEATLGQFSSLSLQWYLADLAVPRGARASELAPHLSKPGVYGSVDKALEAALSQADSADLVIVFGSFYTVAEAKAFWQRRS